ncbi:MAG: tRNA (adenosine(37)-N6)-threonylcarbamoyltransferase complex dimerization subunit type 1 TsaB [Caldilinea sp.]|nr:tRNA (adenosine(37)-N6)-threonylcarbamoyltransferase complex dimerization subunit type 1 TsaB [Caldilinea sp.]MDW8439052.1 tRNA (adenosine(37)-N6)-threonylcarbamoyltransferase complex dimerization subunit type 1 TsaB [Caldilineaceae bacterium]
MDTASTTASAAVYDLKRAQLLGETTWEGRRRQTQNLLILVRHLMATVDVTPADLTALAVTTGPGSFTGVRIAVSAAKGIGLGLPNPPAALGIPTLTVTAAPWHALASACSAAPTVCAVMFAGRGRYHWTLFTAKEPLHRPDANAHRTGTAVDLVAFLGRLNLHPCWLVGEVDADLAAVMRALSHVTVIEPVYGLRRAGVLAHVAAQLLEAGVAESLASLQPLYLREP